MPRYYFNVRDGSVYRDEVGTVLSDDASARAEALAASGEVLKGIGNVRADLWNGEEWLMEVVNESGTTIAELRFSANILKQDSTVK
jgi:hypothetical protein